MLTHPVCATHDGDGFTWGRVATMEALTKGTTTKGKTQQVIRIVKKIIQVNYGLTLMD